MSAIPYMYVSCDINSSRLTRFYIPNPNENPKLPPQVWCSRGVETHDPTYLTPKRELPLNKSSPYSPGSVTRAYKYWHDTGWVIYLWLSEWFTLVTLQSTVYRALDDILSSPLHLLRPFLVPPPLPTERNSLGRVSAAKTVSQLISSLVNSSRFYLHLIILVL